MFTKILLTIGIILLAYFIIGGIYFVLFAYDETMDVIKDDNSSKGQWISIVLTILLYTPYNIVNDVKRFVRGK